MLDSAQLTAAVTMSTNRPLLLHGCNTALLWFIALALASAGGPASAQFIQRQSVPLQSDRELAPKPAPQMAPKTMQPAQKTASGRTGFAARLSASFLASGYSLRVVSQESVAGAEDAKRFPKLTIAGAFDEAFVFKMMSTWMFLEPAMKSGFRSVDILSILNQRHYIYDLTTGTPPRCDIGGLVCH